jgi:hypothetical protein
VRTAQQRPGSPRLFSGRLLPDRAVGVQSRPRGERAALEFGLAAFVARGVPGLAEDSGGASGDGLADASIWRFPLGRLRTRAGWRRRGSARRWRVRRGWPVGPRRRCVRRRVPCCRSSPPPGQRRSHWRSLTAGGTGSCCITSPTARAANSPITRFTSSIGGRRQGPPQGRSRHHAVGPAGHQQHRPRRRRRRKPVRDAVRREAHARRRAVRVRLGPQRARGRRDRGPRAARTQRGGRRPARSHWPIPGEVTPRCAPAAHGRGAGADKTGVVGSSTTYVKRPFRRDAKSDVRTGNPAVLRKALRQLGQMSRRQGSGAHAGVGVRRGRSTIGNG